MDTIENDDTDRLVVTLLHIESHRCARQQAYEVVILSKHFRLTSRPIATFYFPTMRKNHE